MYKLFIVIEKYRTVGVGLTSIYVDTYNTIRNALDAFNELTTSFNEKEISYIIIRGR